MAWLRIDDGFPEHRKIIALKRTERWTWMELMCYCARQNDMGHVPEGVGDIVRGATPAFIRKCVEIELLDRDEDGLRVHDWHDYNPKDPTGPTRQMRYRNKKRNDEVTDNVTDSVTVAAVTDVTPRARALPSPTPLRTTNQPTTSTTDGLAGIGNLQPVIPEREVM